MRDSLKIGQVVEDKLLMRNQLMAFAWQRINEVRNLWADLRSGPNEKISFAAHWVDSSNYLKQRVTSSTKAHFKDEGGKKHLPDMSDDWIGWGLTERSNLPKNHVITEIELRNSVRLGLETLIEDAITYIDWVLEWPRFVQSVRSVEPGSLPIDLRWKP